MSMVLIVSVLVAAGAERALPPWALLVLAAVTLPPAVAVDVLVFVGPRKRPFRDPLASHREENRDREGGDPRTDEPL